jgi:hypothetical protein
VKLPLSSVVPCDGAPAGEYKVTVTWPEGSGNDIPDRLNGKYDLTNTKLTANVNEGTNDIPAFKLSR